MMQVFSRFQLWTVAIAFLATVASNVAFAHPGHGPAAETIGIMHYLLSPSHWGVVALVALFAVLAITMLGKRESITFGG